MFTNRNSSSYNLISCHVLIDTVKETGPEPEVITEAITKAPESETITKAATSSVLAHGKGTITGRNLNLNSIDPKNFIGLKHC